MLGLHANLDHIRTSEACVAAHGTQIADGRVPVSSVIGRLGATDDEVLDQETREFHERALAKFRDEGMN